MITVSVNAKPFPLDGPMSLLELLQRELKVDTQFVAVARNGEVVRKAELAGVTVQDGDVLEVVRPVGGG